MKTKLTGLSFAVILAIVLLTGCLATKQPVITQNPDGTLTTNQVYATTPVVSQIVSGATATAPFIPPPYGTLLTALAGLFGTSVASYVAFKNKQAENKSNGVNASIIEGVEASGSGSDAVKKSIAATSLANGNADDVEAAVQRTV